jgi:hypothetical protein
MKKAFVTFESLTQWTCKKLNSDFDFNIGD